jgi:hypothetical protein
MAPEILTASDSATIRFTFRPARGRQRQAASRRLPAQRAGRERAELSAVTVGQVADELECLGRIVATSLLVARPELGRVGPEREWSETPGAFADRVSGWAPKMPIERLSYASPVEVVIQVSQAIVLSVPALTALIYGVKRLYGLDLELQTHRHELMARFEEAKKASAKAAAEDEADEDEADDKENNELPIGVRTALDAVSRRLRGRLRPVVAELTDTVDEERAS